MRSRRSLKLSHTQTSVPCGTLNNLRFGYSGMRFQIRVSIQGSGLSLSNFLQNQSSSGMATEILVGLFGFLPFQGLFDLLAQCSPFQKWGYDAIP